MISIGRLFVLYFSSRRFPSPPRTSLVSSNHWMYCLNRASVDLCLWLACAKDTGSRSKCLPLWPASQSTRCLAVTSSSAPTLFVPVNNPLLLSLRSLKIIRMPQTEAATILTEGGAPGYSPTPRMARGPVRPAIVWWKRLRRTVWNLTPTFSMCWRILRRQIRWRSLKHYCLGTWKSKTNSRAD